jgi:fucose permease
MYLFLCVGGEISFADWLATYTMEIGWGEEREADYITSAFWISLTLGRMVSVALSTVFKLPTMLIIDWLGCFGSVIILAGAQTATLIGFPQQIGEITLWISAILFGFSIANVYPSVVSLRTQANLRATGTSTSVMMFMGSFGNFSLPPICSLLFTYIGPEIFPWFVLAIVVLTLFIYVFLIRSANIPFREIFSLKSKPQQL